MKEVYISLVLCTLILSGCTTEHKKEHSAAFSGEDEEQLSTEISMSAEGDNKKEEIQLVNLSNDASETASTMQKLGKDIEAINSPDKLMEYGEAYERKLAETYQKIEAAKSPEERAKLQAYLNEIKHDYNNKKNEYTLPANGIIQNIEKLTKRLESCQSKSEFMNILDPRISYFNNLTKLHTLVAEENRRQEVREMAERLNVLFQKKKAQFGIVY